MKRLVVPAAAASLPDSWHEKFVIPYGPGKALLGTSPGGDSGTLDIGPEYGAPGPDGTWWFLDYAKGRLAHFDADGAFLEAVRPDAGAARRRRLLPVAAPARARRRHPGGSAPVDRQPAPAPAPRRRARRDPRRRRAVQHDVRRRHAALRVRPGQPAGDGRPRPTARSTRPTLSGRRRARRSRSGSPSTAASSSSGCRTLGVSKRLPLRTASGAKAHVGIQVRAGTDDTLHLFLVGTGEDDESLQLVGYTSVSPAGAVSEVEGLPEPVQRVRPRQPRPARHGAGLVNADARLRPPGWCARVRADRDGFRSRLSAEDCCDDTERGRG